MVSAIVAQAHGRVIGKNNDLPWYLPADLRHFKELTSGHTVIMGRKTHESIVQRLGKPLPNRRNIVVTRNPGFSPNGAEAAHSLEAALDLAKEDQNIFVIGGAQIFDQALPLLDSIYLTQVNAEIDGDTYFPELGDEWQETSHEAHEKDEKNPYDYKFITLVKSN